jgi:hypothetical protein
MSERGSEVAAEGLAIVVRCTPDGRLHGSDCVVRLTATYGRMRRSYDHTLLVMKPALAVARSQISRL